jgi:alkylhydroperoxidase family enzyme
MAKARPPAVVFEELVDRVTRGPGETSPVERKAAASPHGEGLPPALAAVLEKVRKHAYKVTDADVAALRGAGLSEDAIYELTIAAAVGVAKGRLEQAMGAIDAAE